MSAIAVAVKHMLAAGMGSDAIVAAVAEMEAALAAPIDAVAEKRRAYDRERKRSMRMSGGSPVESAESADNTPSPSSPPDPPNTPAPGKYNTRARKADFVLPDWVPKAEWEAFDEMRKATGHKMTDKARVIAIRELDKLRSAGNDPAAVLNQSTMKSWRGLFGVARQADEPKIVDPSKWTAERRAAYAKALDSPDDAASRAMKVRSIGDLAQDYRRTL